MKYVIAWNDKKYRHSLYSNFKGDIVNAAKSISRSLPVDCAVAVVNTKTSDVVFERENGDAIILF